MAIPINWLRAAGVFLSPLAMLIVMGLLNPSYSATFWDFPYLLAGLLVAMLAGPIVYGIVMVVTYSAVQSQAVKDAARQISRWDIWTLCVCALLFTFPAILIAILGPAFMQIAEAFQRMDA